MHSVLPSTSAHTAPRPAAAARRLTRPSASLAASQRAPEDAPPVRSVEIELEQVRTESQRQLLVAEQNYKALEHAYDAQVKAKEALERQTRDLLREWEGRQEEIKETESLGKAEIVSSGHCHMHEQLEKLTLRTLAG